MALVLAHRSRSDFCNLRLRCPARSAETSSDFRDFALRFANVRWKVASDLRFGVAISEAKTPSFCGIPGELAPSMRKSLAIAIVRFWCAKALVFSRTSKALKRRLPTSTMNATPTLKKGMQWTVLGLVQEVSRIRFRVRFQAVKVPSFGGFPVENPTNKATASKLF